jgi:cytochrome P450
MDEDAFAVDPLPHFVTARAKHPWLARWAHGYVITDYKAMRDLFVMEDKMGQPYNDIVAHMGAEDTPWGNFQKRHMLNMSGATHKRVRDILAPAFTPRQANRHRGLMQEVISKQLDEWAPKGSFDFEEFASYFPVTVMCRLIGADPVVIPRLRSAMEAIGRSTSMDKRWLPAMQEGTVTLDTFSNELIARRRKENRAGIDPDLLDLLLKAQAESDLSDRELVDILIFLFVAGYDTSKNMLTLAMWMLMDRPDIYKKCAQDPTYARKAIEETFRYHSIISAQRSLYEDIVYRDVLLEKGAFVWFTLSVATHDPRYADNPDVFDPEREQRNIPIGFGLGAHMCLGQHIARAQITEGLHLIAQRLRNPRTTGPQSWRGFPGTWGIQGLPIEFDLAGAERKEVAHA